MSRLTRLSTAEFDRLVAEGSIREGSRTYLWDGEVIEPMPENRPTRTPSKISATSWSRNCRVRSGRSTRATQWNCPTVTNPSPTWPSSAVPGPTYQSQTPRAADVALLVEVSASSYLDDSGEFLRRYAQEGIVQYWIVNIPARRVEIYLAPDPLGASLPGQQTLALDAEVPFVLSIGNDTWAYAGLAVADILRDSLDEP